MHRPFVGAARALSVAVLGIAAAGAMPNAASASSQPPPRLYVSVEPTHNHYDNSCWSARYSTIQAAVDAASPGSEIVVCPGTYHEGVQVDRQISLVGWGAVIDAAGSSSGNGVHIEGPGGSGSSVEGFRIEDAPFEGILVGTAPVAPGTTDGEAVTSGQPVQDVRIAYDQVIDNDADFATAYGQCYSTPEAPGDCGEAIHLVAVTGSTVERDYVSDNAGGILLTDEFGPSSGNLIRDDYSIDNESDCGITLASHSAAISPVTLQPTGAGGVFDNTVLDNVSIGNGTKGQGAGILLGGGAPYAGVYDNVIRGNYAHGNGLAGITIHQHLIGDLNGNVIEGNSLSDNDLDGDFDFEAAADPETTDILVASGKPPHAELPPFLLPGPIEGTVIRHNRIGGAKVGIWTLNVDPATTQINGNWFEAGVVTDVSSH